MSLRRFWLFGCAVSSWPCRLFSSLVSGGLLSSYSEQASHWEEEEPLQAVIGSWNRHLPASAPLTPRKTLFCS